MMKAPTRADYVKEFLNFFWLRPENAFLLAVRAQAYRETIDRYFGPGKGTIDVSCGDGVFSFITMGGKLSERTDMFRAVDMRQAVRQGNFDAFDHMDESYLIEVSRRPEKTYEHGSDWKPNLLKKAEKIEFYKNHLVHNNNKPLPFTDQSMNYVYSNSAYWVQNFEAHLADLSRITRSGGHIVLEMKTTAITRFTSKNYLPQMGSRFHEIVDAGRLTTWKGLRSKADILKIVDNIPGTRLESEKPIYGDSLAMIWDIGLRPLFNPLVRMANGCDEATRLQAKKEWCQILFELFAKYIEEYRVQADGAIEHILVLEKK